MRELVKFELSKIFQKKIIYIIALLISVFTIIGSVEDFNDVKSSFGSVEGLKKELKNYEGEIDLQKQLEIKKEIALIKDKVYNQEKLTEDEEKLNNLSWRLSSYYRTNLDPEYLINGKKYTLSEMGMQLNKGHEDSYEYRNLEKAYKSISKVGKPKFAYLGGWGQITDFRVAATMMVILVVLGISTIFSDEHKTNVIPVILSTPNGRKKLTVAKIISALIYATCIFVFNSVLYFISGLPFGLDGFNSMISTLEGQAPYSVTIIQFYFIALGMSLLGVIVLSLFTSLVSLLTKNSMVTLIVGLGLYFFQNLVFGLSLPQVLRQISVYELIRVKDVLLFYNSFNIFGKPVLYPTVIIIAALVVIPTLVSGIRYFGRRQSV